MEPMPDSSLSLVNETEEKLSLKEQEEDASNDEAVNYFDTLPVLMILNIFKYLDLKSLCRAAQVNRTFYELSLEPELYEELNLKRYWSTVGTNALDFLKDRCTRLKKLNFSWCGVNGYRLGENFCQFLDQCQSTLTHVTLDERGFITSNILLALMKCKGLVELRLRNGKIGNNWDCLRKSEWKLQTLDLTGCDINTAQLQNLIKTCLEHLRHINIDFCYELLTYDIAALATSKGSLESWSSFTTFHWKSVDGLVLFARCRKLIELNLGWCLVARPENSLAQPKNCLAQLSEGCPDLERLDLGGWPKLDGESLAPIIDNCKKLTHLSIVGAYLVPPESILKALNTLPNLQFLNLDAKIPNSDVAEWKRVFPQVTIWKGSGCEENERWTMCSCNQVPT